jgi:hypothetical protein
MGSKEPALWDKIEEKRVTSKWVESVSFLLLSVVGVTGSFWVNRSFPISDFFTLLLIGIGIISSVILLKIG